MSEFVTKDIYQLPVAETVPVATRLAMQQGADSPMQGVEIKRLFAHAIATDAIFDTEADAQLELDYDEDDTALVVADPDPLKSGWYRKVGARNAGNWVQFERLSYALQSLVQAAKDEADRAAAAAELATKVPSSIKPRLINVYDLRRASGATVTPIFGDQDIDLDAALNNSYELTAHGVLFKLGLLRIPVQVGAKAITIFYRTPNDQTGTRMLLSGGQTSGNGTLVSDADVAKPGPVVTPTESHFVSSYGFDMLPVLHNEATGAGAYSLALGGWTVYQRNLDQTYNTEFGVGGIYNGSNLDQRCTEIEVAGAAIWNDYPTDDDKADALLMFRKQALEAGTIIHHDDAPMKVEVNLFNGDSTSLGQSDLAALSVADQIAIMRHSSISAVGPTAAAPYQDFDVFEMGYNQRISDNAGTPATKFGPAYGIALAHRKVALERGQLYLMLLGQGGSYTAPVGGLISDAITWHPDANKSHGLLYVAMKQAQYLLQRLLEHGMAPREMKLSTMTGLNDGVNEANAPSVAVYAGYEQARYDAWKAIFPGMPVRQRMIRPHIHDPLTDPIAMANVRGGQNSMANANPLVDHIDIDPLVAADGTGLNADKAHYNGSVSIECGRLLYEGQS